jgi:hypothetical protein
MIPISSSVIRSKKPHSVLVRSIRPLHRQGPIRINLNRLETFIAKFQLEIIALRSYGGGSFIFEVSKVFFPNKLSITPEFQ